MKKLFSISLLMCLLSLMACKENGDHDGKHETSFNLDSVKAAINASNLAYGNAYTNNDSAAWVDSYTTDAKLFTPNGPTFTGKSEIGSFYIAAKQMGLLGLKATTSEVMGSEECVSELGTYEAFGANNVSIDKGKYIVLWKKEDGKWKMHRDIFNSDNPPPPPPPAKK